MQREWQVRIGGPLSPEVMRFLCQGRFADINNILGNINRVMYLVANK